MNAQYRSYRGRVIKAPGVEAYQLLVTSLVRRARPSDWVPSPQLRILYDFYLKRDMDCDNAMKAMNDAIAVALDVNDRIFLPCVRRKETKVHDPYVLLEIRPLETDVPFILS
jgi:hypothetical protein